MEYRENTEAEGPYRYWMTCLSGAGLGNRSKRQLLDCYKSPSAVYRARKEELDKLGFLRQREVDALIFQRGSWDLREEYERFLGADMGLVTLDMEGYPANLRMLHDAPFGLFFRGRIPSGVSGGSSRLAAVVGSRTPSAYGKRVAEDLSAILTDYHYQIVSGMARGIDGIAQTSCLDTGGQTIAVLGCGADIVYPKENWILYDRIVETGCLFSEYPPQTAPLSRHFPARNRIISGLASVVLVIEARRRSGSLITADFALEQGKDVYTLPGRITDPMSAGCNELLHQGAAQPITDYDQLIDDLELIAGMGHFQPREDLRRLPPLTREQEKLYQCLDFYPMDLDQLVKRSELDYLQAVRVLTELCDLGIAVDSSHNQFLKLR